MTKPRIPPVPGPSPDEDPTGVRALLSSLPAPDPMPQHLVERINASLAAEHAQRAAGASGASDASVSPLLTTRRDRRGRLVFAMAGAAAAVALVSVVGNGLVKTGTTDTSVDRGTVASTSNPEAAAGAAAPSTKPLARASAPGAGSGSQFSGKESAVAAAPAPSTIKTSEPTADAAPGGSIVAIRQSGTRYTRSDFATQARALGSFAKLAPPRKPTALSDVGPAGTPSGLRACLRALGAGAAQLVWADVALYEGQPAVIIVATTRGVPIAYAVEPKCSRAGPEVLHPATPLR